jgi:gas vesicle protein
METTIKSRYNELKDLLESYEKDFEKFYDKQNKSAGTRVRKAMNDIKRKAQDIRKEVQEMKTTDKPAA